MPEAPFEKFHSGFVDCHCNASEAGDCKQAAPQYKTNAICHVNSSDLKPTWTSHDGLLHVLTGLTVEPRKRHTGAQEAFKSRSSRHWLLPHLTVVWRCRGLGERTLHRLQLWCLPGQWRINTWRRCSESSKQSLMGVHHGFLRPVLPFPSILSTSDPF